MMYFAYLGSETEVLTNAHLRQDEQILNFSYIEERGDRGTRIPNATIEVVNTGLARLIAGPRYCAVMKSEDGTIASAEIICKGYVKPVPGNITADTIKLDIICAGTDTVWDIARAALAIVETYDTPQFDRLFGEVDITNINYVDGVNGERNPVLQRLRDNPNSALESVSAFWRTDPVTHAITQEDIIDSASPTINIDLNYISDSLQVTLNQPPVKQVRMTVVADWTQYVTGFVDISSLLNQQRGTVCYTTYEDYSGNFAANNYNAVPPPIAFLNETGWSINKFDTNITRTFDNIYSLTFDAIASVSRYQSALHGSSYQWNTAPSFTYTATIPVPTNFYAYRYTVSYNYFILNYSYTQERQERCVVVLDGGIQDVDTLNFDDILDLGEVSLSDLYQIPNVYPYDPWKTYNTGDQVVAGGRLYQCTKNGTNSFFTTWYIGGQFVERTIGNWTQLTTTAAFDKSIYDTYFDSARGQISIKHAVNRCRAAWRKRLLFQSVTIENTWENFAGIDITKKVRVRLPNDITGASYQPVVGKVSRVEKTWNSDYQSVKITIDVPYGDSTNIPAVAAGATVIGDVQYVVSAEDAIYNPVDTNLINTANYAVVEAAVLNDADTQKGNMSRIADAGNTHYADFVSAGFYPTQIRLKMRNLISVPKVARYISIAATPTIVPRGINLASLGAEP